jgi:uncharacterized Zn finger protein (UPF0148 family)
MSDFDKEAERERLREKYERDKQKREATEQMSELLLQGATMTNAHCSECNDPIFRYDGQEFCATCEKPVDRDTGEESDDETTESADAGNIEVTSPSDDARVRFGGETDQPDTPDEPTEPQQPEGNSRGDQRTAERSEPRQGQHSNQGPRSQRPRSQEPHQQRSQSHGTPQQGTGSQSATDVKRVEASLVRTMTRFAEQAETTEDPQQAVDSLAAVREAAETLDALR